MPHNKKNGHVIYFEKKKRVLGAWRSHLWFKVMLFVSVEACWERSVLWERKATVGRVHRSKLCHWVERVWWLWCPQIWWCPRPQLMAPYLWLHPLGPCKNSTLNLKLTSSSLKTLCLLLLRSSRCNQRYSFYENRVFERTKAKDFWDPLCYGNAWFVFEGYGYICVTEGWWIVHLNLHNLLLKGLLIKGEWKVRGEVEVCYDC